VYVLSDSPHENIFEKKFCKSPYLSYIYPYMPNKRAKQRKHDKKKRREASKQVKRKKKLLLRKKRGY